MGPTWNAPRTDPAFRGPRYPQAAPGRWRRIPPLANLAPDCRIIRGAGASLQAIFVAVLLLLASGGALAQDIKAPKISIAAVDWDTARAALNASEGSRRLSASADATRTAPDLLARMNQISATVFPNIAA